MSARFLIEPVLEGHFGATVVPYSSKLRCPFHDDSHASGWHNDYYFKCMACDVKGDAIGLLMRQGGLEPRAAYTAAEGYSGKPDESVSEQPRTRGRIPGRQRDYRGHSRYGSTGSGR